MMSVANLNYYFKMGIFIYSAWFVFTSQLYGRSIVGTDQVST